MRRDAVRAGRADRRARGAAPELWVLFAKLTGGGLLALAAWLAFRTVPTKL